jgi:hypothetical protein
MTRDKAAKKAARNRAAGTGEPYTRARRAVEAEADQARWWRAYVLAENDRPDELRQHAEAGDDHARRQLASWLADRGRVDEAITVIRPLAEADDEIAQLWLARWLADGDHAGELRRRAGTGDGQALRHLAGWLADHGRLGELRELLIDHRELLTSSWGSGQYQQPEVLRLKADLGDDEARRMLGHWLARTRRRAQAGDKYAQRALAEWQEQRSDLES